MSKSIGTKIFSFLMIIIVFQLGFIVFAFFGLTNIKSSNERTMDIYVGMDVRKGDAGEALVQVRLAADMAVLLDDMDKKQEFYNELDGDIAELNAILDEMQALGDQGATQELLDTFAEFRENVKTFCDTVPTACDIAMAGDNDAGYEVLDGLSSTINRIEELEGEVDVLIEQEMATAEQELLNNILMIQVLMVVVGVVIIAVIIVAIIVTTKTIAHPAKHASIQMHDIIGKISREEGDLTARVEVSSKDEVGQLAGGINEFLAQLQGIIKKLKDETQTMLNAAHTTMGHVNESNDNASNVSAAMQQLAASMQEVAATIADIVTSSEEMLNAVQSMNDQAEGGANLVSEIKQRAEGINANTVESKRTIDNMIREIRGTLEGAVEESRSVDKINELTDEILNISSQTNLLALNASIEAARAGEAGKGFAVVADEIRVLAENSKNTANNIQEISQLVTAAVSKLATNAESMLQFIDQKVLNDYDDFVEAAKQYYNDADSMNHILNDFSMYTANIEGTMKNMNDGITGISTTVDESAKGVASAAENAGRLVDAISQIHEEAQKTENVSNQLSHEVRRFKNV